MTDRKSDKYTAVLFVHGMGRQVRHENVGELLAALELFNADSTKGVLRSFKAGAEPSRSERPGADVPFVQFDHFTVREKMRSASGRWRFHNRFRAYEVHWSPLTSRAVFGLRVFFWALRALRTPIVVARSGWREKRRIRLGRLHLLRMRSAGSDTASLSPQESYAFASAAAWLHRFTGAEGRRFEARSGGPKRSKGALAAFLAFVRSKAAQTPARLRAPEIVQEWDATRLPVETFSLRLLRITAGIAIAAAIAAGLLLVMRPDVPPILLGIGALLALIPAIVVYRFLALTFSGVYIWNSLDEHDRYHSDRLNILAETSRMIAHILTDSDCKRLIVVGHSLGTAIAHDALRQAGRRNEARPAPVLPLRKLSHFITLGSPIDKIAYHFESIEDSTYRASRLREALRGDLSGEPFYDGGQRIQWVNFWDPADAVSDPLYTPMGSLTDGATLKTAEILNIRVENTAGGGTWGNHIGYLLNPTVVQALNEAILFGRPIVEASLENPRRRHPRDWAQLAMGLFRAREAG